MTNKPKFTDAAVVHSHFHIHIKPPDEKDEVPEGEPTVEEKIAAVERFVKWHERNAVIGREMLKKLEEEKGP